VFAKKSTPAWTNSVKPPRVAPWLDRIGNPPRRDLVGRPRLAKGFGASVAASGSGHIRRLRKPLSAANSLCRWHHLQREMGSRPGECVDRQGRRRLGARIGCQRNSTPDDGPIGSGVQGRQVASSVNAGRRLWVEASTGLIGPVRVMETTELWSAVPTATESSDCRRPEDPALAAVVAHVLLLVCGKSDHPADASE
jgi:hypothetical protein